MAGIYLHIPFCKQACNYCDFHFSTTLNRKAELVNAIVKEIEQRKSYLENESISTIYFGGGTPSLLIQSELEKIIETVNKNFAVENDAEITIEVNPDDLNPQKLKDLKAASFNRLSIGVQSFHDADLKFMNRAHTATEAITSIKEAQNAGFSNITMDLIYGVQTLSNHDWGKNLDTFLSLNLPHLSSYCLTIEPQTALASAIKKGKCENISDVKGQEQFEFLMSVLEDNNFIQYEISNFCKEGFESKHNSAYWKNKKYLGIGPSAHSYNGNSRQWNISNNVKYIEGIKNNSLNYQDEILTQNEQFNEYVMTSLRTIWGINLEHVQQHFGESFEQHLNLITSSLITSQNIKKEGSILTLTQKGKLIADGISSELFIL
ncbi:MAG: radical SAM family heme chaperone HemW [Flavobacteriales bacterium]|nr:radical SAM family heme chaperone HemW [Flavobacteriales bacterium]